MANTTSWKSDVSSFFSRLRGQDQLRTTDSLKILDTPQSPKEKETKQKIQYISQYIRNKNYNRRHVELYDEYRRMDYSFPIIKAALDIYSEECLTACVSISLLNGTTKTIGELYKEKKQKFWVYSFNTETQKFISVQCEKIIHKGKKKVYEVVLDDGTIIKCTNKHLWLTTENHWIKTEDLKQGESLRSFDTRLDDEDYQQECMTNHRVVSIKELEIEEDVYDLVNCGEYSNFAIKANEGMIITHNCTSKDTHGDILKVVTENEKVKKILEDLYFKILRINSRAFLIIRNFCKFGNCYAYIVTRPRVGVSDIVFLPPETVVRQHGEDPENLDYFRFLWYGGGSNATFEPWEIVHWKNIEDIESEPYGTSILRCIVDTWRRVVLIREALVVYRVTRAPSKLLFKVATDGLEAEEALKFAQELKKEVTKKPLVNPETGEIDFRYNPMPLSKNTPIPLLDNRVLSIENLAKEFEEGKINYVYSLKESTDEVVPGKVVWCGKNYTANKLIRIWLDNNSYVDSAPEHPFILRDGTEKRADELLSGDSLMPFYQKLEVLFQTKGQKANEYNTVYNPASGKFEFVHRLIAEEVDKNEERFNTVHHKNFNRFDNTPDNLEWVDFFEHKKRHSAVITAYNKTPELREKVAETNRKFEKTKNMHQKRQAGQYLNHKVARIEILENCNTDVYCMTVVGLNGENDRHNFAYLGIDENGVTTSGSFVYNSVEESIFLPTYEGSPSDVSVLEGASNLDQVEDYKIIKDDLFAGLKIPKSFLNFEEDLSTKGALIEEDVRFAKTSQRIQSEFIEGLIHLGIVHLFMNGCSEEEIQSFTIEMNNPSSNSEKKKIEIMQAKLEVAKSAWDYNNTGLNFFSFVDVLRSVFNFTEEEVRKSIVSQFTEKKIMWRLEQLRTTGTYDEPELEKILNKTKELTSGEDLSKIDVLSTIKLEGKEYNTDLLMGDSIQSLIKDKIQQELDELFPKASSGPSKKQVLLIESSIRENLETMKKELKS